MSKELTIEKFMQQVEKHELTILRDDGLYRHLKLAVPGTDYESFQIVTWPGFLAYAGDMGAFTFSRITDMFEFFRGRMNGNHQYWAEKCVAADKDDGLRKFCPETFESAVRDDIAGQVEDASLVDAIVDEVMHNHNGGAAGMESVESALDFMMSGDFSDVEVDGREFNLNFEGFYEHTIEDYTGRFKRCCFALPWAIQKYDRVKGELVGAAFKGAIGGGARD